MNWVILILTIWQGLVSGVSYSLFATGLTLIFGILFVANFAHGELFMLAAILLHVLMKMAGLNFFVAAIISIIVVAAFGFVFNRVVVKPLLGSLFSGMIATLAVSMLLMYGVQAILGPNSYVVDSPFTGITQIGDIRLSTESIVLFGIGLITILTIMMFINKTRIGKDMQATIQNPVGASLSGINTTRVYDFTLILASGLAALGGILMAVLVLADPVMGQSMLIKGFAIVVAAGMGNLRGAIILGIVFGVLESLFSMFVTPYFRETFIYGIMVLILLFRPEGLFSSVGDR